MSVDKPCNLQVALDYREQMQELSHLPKVLDDEVLVKFHEHLRELFPFDKGVDPFGIEELRELLKGIDPNYSFESTEVAKILRESNIDSGSPLFDLIPTTSISKYDDISSSSFTNEHTITIVKACEELGYDLKGGVSIGLNDTANLQATQHPVFLTDTSVIQITTQLHLICHRLSKLLAKSFAFSEFTEQESRLSGDLDDYKFRLFKTPELQKEWDFFFSDCGYQPNSPPRGNAVKFSRVHEQSYSHDLCKSMTQFVLGHECGHHIANHSLDGVAASGMEDISTKHFLEHEADIIGSNITMCIGNFEEDPNWFSATNIGSSCILKVLDMIKESNAILTNGVGTIQYESSESHPSTEARIQIMNKVVPAFYKEELMVKRTLEMHELFTGLLDFIWSNSSKHIKKLHDSGVRAETTTKEWLP